jgi:hypothetical protein
MLDNLVTMKSFFPLIKWFNLKQKLVNLSTSWYYNLFSCIFLSFAMLGNLELLFLSPNSCGRIPTITVRLHLSKPQTQPDYSLSVWAFVNSKLDLVFWTSSLLSQRYRTRLYSNPRPWVDEASVRPLRYRNSPKHVFEQLVSSNILK